MSNLPCRNSLLGAFSCYTHTPLPTFPANLCKALRKKGFSIDDHVLNDGDQNSFFLVKVNENSTIPLVVLSQNFASSPSRLDQLVAILEDNQPICPIFYKVDPLDVRRQRGTYSEAMAEHENTFDSDVVQKWMSALRKVTNMQGWRFQTNGYKEKQAIDDILEWFTENSYSFRYDVLLSFHKEDTGYSFTRFLDNSLQRERFNTFLAHEGVEAEELTQAIKESRLFLVVFSEKYAYSSSCLDGLVDIAKHKSETQRICPIFFRVSPSDVRHQTNGYGNAMDEHEIDQEDDSDKLDKWRSALSEVASISGWPLETGYEYKTIEKIVEKVNRYLPRYDIFLSFRGDDTRYNFTGHLYKALCEKGFKTFMDEEVLEGGDEISPTIIKAIKEAKSSIIVFSENYAHSSWCLDELVNILNCKKTKNHVVWPIFYKVEPSDVWMQRNSYKRAMDKHVKRFGKKYDKVKKWRSALSEVADLVKEPELGKWHFTAGYEDEFIRNIEEMVTSA